MNALVEVDPRVDDRWRELVARSGGSLFHSPEWSAILADAYRWEPRATMTLDAAGAPLAGMPWCRVSDPGGDRIVSLPFSDYCGPIGESGESPDQLFRALDRLGLPLRWRILVDAHSPSPQSPVGVARWHGLRTGGTAEEAWARLDATARRAVRAARRSGVTVVERADAGVLPQFLRLHTGVRKRKYRLLPQPLRFFEALRSQFAPLDAWHPLVAMRHEEILAITMYIRSGDTLFYKFNASDPRALDVRPNDLLLWEGIELAIRLGCNSLDLGASDDDQPGLIRFKRKFGAHEREIRTLVAGPPLPPAHSVVRAVLRDLTEQFTDDAVSDDLTEAAGAVLYRYFA